jgi:O-antigen/teichoic acid export membrane protein
MVGLKQPLKRLRESPAVRNFGWLMIDRVVRMLLSVVVGVWVARYLGPEQYGAFSYVLAGVALLGPLTELGFDVVARREFVRRPEESAMIAGTIFRIRLVGAVVAFGLIGLYVAVADITVVERYLFLIVGLTLFQPSLRIADAWLQSRLAAKHSVAPQWIGLLFGAAARVTAIGLGFSLVAFAWIYVAEAVLAAGSLLLSAKLNGFGLGSLNRDTARTLFRESWPLALSSAAIMIYMKIDVVMLRSMVGETAAGIYSAAVRLSELAYFLPMAAAVSLQPALVRAYAGEADQYRRLLRRYFNWSVLTAYLFAGGLTVASPWTIRLLYGVRFAEAAPILMVHAWAMVFVFLGVARGQHLVNAGLTRVALGFTISGALLNMGMNLLLIPRWGGLGAAIATVCSYAVASWLSSFFHRDTRWVGLSQTHALLLPWRLSDRV